MKLDSRGINEVKDSSKAIYNNSKKIIMKVANLTDFPKHHRPIF